MSEKKAKEERRDWECKKCGRCCCIWVTLNQHGLQFITPAPIFVCNKLNVKTNLCKDYDNRPQKCKDYNCHSKQSFMHLNIKGVPKNANGTGEIDKKENKEKNTSLLSK